MYNKLIALADQLDAKNLHTEASLVDAILQEAYFRANDSAGGVPVVMQDDVYQKVKDKEDFEPLPWEAREEELKKQLAKQPLDKLKDLFEAIKKTVLGGAELKSKFTFAAGQELGEHDAQLKMITTLLEEGKIEEVVKTLATVPKSIGQFILNLIKDVAKAKLPKTEASLSVKADPTDNQPIQVDVKVDGQGGVSLAGEGEPTQVYLMVAKMIPPGNQLFINPNVRTPSAATNDNLKAYFDFKDTKSSTYELVKPAQIDWNGSQGKVISKGVINF